jgi:hypothetical protein
MDQCRYFTCLTRLWWFEFVRKNEVAQSFSYPKMHIVEDLFTQSDRFTNKINPILYRMTSESVVWHNFLNIRRIVQLMSLWESLPLYTKAFLVLYWEISNSV